MSTFWFILYKLCMSLPATIFIWIMKLGQLGKEV